MRSNVVELQVERLRRWRLASNHLERRLVEHARYVIATTFRKAGLLPAIVDLVAEIGLRLAEGEPAVPAGCGTLELAEAVHPAPHVGGAIAGGLKPRRQRAAPTL